MTATLFSTLQLNDKLLRGIEDAGYSHCMPVQEQTFPHTFKGADVYVQSQTGTGKTAAFLVSIFQLFLNDNTVSRKKSLIIAPTRELAIQIEKEAKLLGRYLDFTIGCLYGGVGYARQEKLLSDNVQIIIGTPGRLLDFCHKGKLHLQEIGILVIDEADRMFDMGFLPDVRRMVKKMPPATQRLTMLFSATLDYRVQELAWEYMNDPVEINIESERVTVDNITQELYHVSRDEKMSLLLGILKREQPANALIFTNTKHKAVEVAQRLEHNDYPCKYIMGDLPQAKRSEVIEGVKAGTIRFLVATDVAARGLHIDDLELVVNYDLPSECENYIHRIGRTARAGKSGKAITLACERYVLELEAIEKLIDAKIPVMWPEDDSFAEDKSAGKHFSGAKKDLKRGSRRVSRRPPAQRKASSRESTPAKKSPPRRKTSSRPKAAGQKTLEANKTARKAPRKRDASNPASREARLEYYSKKYGESFATNTDRPAVDLPPVTRSSVRKKSLLNRLVSLCTGKS